MIILTQDKRAIITIGDFDSLTLGDGESGRVYFRHDGIDRLIAEYPSGYMAQAVIQDIYNTYGLSPKYEMPSIGQAKRLHAGIL